MGDQKQESEIVRDRNTPIDTNNRSERDKVKLSTQLPLSGACFGLELMMTFVSIYGILSLQYLDVPVSMVTLHGLVCSSISLVVIPFIGRFTDQGGNTRIRKAISLLVGLFFIIGAFIFIFISCIIKINTEPLNVNFTSTNHSIFPNQMDSPESNPASIPITAVLAILGFAFIDIGFDVSMAPTRAFILESVPTWQHSSVLTTATVTSSFAGVFLASVGLFEVPLHIAAAVSSADQMAVALMCLCVFIALVIIASFLISLLTGFRIIKLRKESINLNEKFVNDTSKSDDDLEHPRQFNNAGDILSAGNSRSLQEKYSKETPRMVTPRTNTFVQLLNKRIVILLVASFFSYGAMIGFLTFASNSLTIGVYRGDPQALPGTEARQNYIAGLRMSSVGVLVYYIFYFVISSFSKKILDVAGPKVFFIAANFLMALTSLLFTLTGHLVAYFAAMLACSVHKSMSYTVPFLLATIYAQPQANAEKELTDKDQNQKLGRVTSLVGFLLPAQSLIMCSSMGPLMSVTDSSWPPMYYVIAVGCLAAIVMCGIYVLKK